MPSKNVSHYFEYRSFWMGIAILGVVLHHTWYPFHNRILFYIMEFGYCGVDIFLFCSGYGCCRSYCRDQDPLAFLGRRIRRIFPSWALAMALWLPYRILRGHMGLPAALGNLLGLQTFTGLGNDFNWYISGILTLYILTPYFAAICRRCSAAGNAAFLLFLTAVSIPFLTTFPALMFVSRIPLYYAGICAGKLADHPLSRKQTVLVLLTGALGWAVLLPAYISLPDLRWSYGIGWYPFLLITPGLCLCLSAAADWLTRHHAAAFIRAVSRVGTVSFELFITHLMLFPFLYGKADALAQQERFGVLLLLWAAGALISLAAALVLRRLADALLQLMSRLPMGHTSKL